MAIFGRDETPESEPAPQQRAQPPAEPKAASRATLISGGTLVTGEIAGATEIQIEGRVEGTLNVDALVSVGSAGQVRGEIRAKSVAVAGQVVGNIHGKDKVDIHSGAKLEGDVKAPRVSIADGAYFKGRVEMTSGSTPQAQATKPVSQPAAKPQGQPPLDAVKAGESAK